MRLKRISAFWYGAKNLFSSIIEGRGSWGVGFISRLSVLASYNNYRALSGVYPLRSLTFLDHSHKYPAGVAYIAPALRYFAIMRVH